MTPQLRSDLIRIFSDAHVIDLDFGKWDRQVSIWVISDHWGERGAILCVDFLEVQDVHLCIPKRDPDLDPGTFVQWLIDKPALQAVDNGNWKLVLASLSDSSPSCELRFSGVHIYEESENVLNIVNPGWSRPGAPFARPDLRRLYTHRRNS